MLGTVLGAGDPVVALTSWWEEVMNRQPSRVGL